MFENFVNYPYNNTRPNVYVVSDSTYKNYQKTQAQDQIAYLQNELARYERLVKATKDNILEVQTNAGLLPEVEEPQATTE